MVNKKFLTGILGIILVFGLVFAGCDNGSTDDDDNDDDVLPSTDGLLAVTGLSEYNGKYIVITSLSANEHILVGFADFNKSTGVGTRILISNGTADVKIYEGDTSGKIKGYSGSDTVSLVALIYASKTGREQDATFAVSDDKSVSFQNGKAAAAFTFTGGSGGSEGGSGNTGGTETGGNPFIGTWRANSGHQLIFGTNTVNANWAPIGSGTGTYTYTGNTASVNYGGWVNITISNNSFIYPVVLANTVFYKQ